MTGYENKIVCFFILIFIFILTFSPLSAESRAKLHHLHNSSNKSETIDYKEITGDILIIGKDFIRIREDFTNKIHDIKASKTLLAKVQSGYRVFAIVEDGELTFIKPLGMHKESEPIIINP